MMGTAVQHELWTLTPAHLADLLDLCAGNLPLDTFSTALLRSRLFDDPRHEPHFAIGAAVDGKLIGAAVGIVRTMPEGDRHGWIKLLVVDRGFRRRGLGTRLLAELEHRFHAAGLRHLDTVGAPYYFWPGVDVRYTPACCLFEHAGFVEKRYTVNMIVDLAERSFDTTEAERRFAKEGFVLSRADAGSLPRILSFIARDWPLWTEEVPIAMTNDPISLFQVTRGQEVVAFAAYNVAIFPGAFGPTGTAASLRGRGLGTLLLCTCLQEMKALGYRYCEIAWAGPVGFYTDKVGAVINRVFRDYQKPLS